MSYVCILYLFVDPKDLKLHTRSFTLLPLKLHSVPASDAISTAEPLVTRLCRSADTTAQPPHYHYHARETHKPLRHITPYAIWAEICIRHDLNTGALIPTGTYALRAVAER